MDNSFLGRISHKLTSWVGTPASIIVHSLLFIGIFALRIFGVSTEEILLVLTTAVSLEAIYLAIFIQMSVNRQITSIASVVEDIDEIQEDVEGIQEDVQGLETDVEEISEDVEDITENLDEISADELEEDKHEEESKKTLSQIEDQLRIILTELDSLRKKKG